MLDYITKPSSDAITDLTNAEEHLSVAEGSTLPSGAGTFDIYVAIAGTIAVTNSVLTAANDGDEAEFFYTGSPGGNIGITIGGAGPYAGTYPTDYLGATFTLADVQSAPVCLLAPVISGTTGDGDVLTIQSSLWIYDGPTIAPLSRQQKLDGTNVPIDEGGDELTFTIDIWQHSEQVFTVEETFGGTTVTSNSKTVDTAVGSFMANDVDAKFWWNPANIQLDGGGLVTGWPNDSSIGDTNWDLTSTDASGQFPTWDAVNSKLVGNGTDMGIRGAGDLTLIDGGYSLFFVADASSGNSLTNTTIFADGGLFEFMIIGLGTSGGNLTLFLNDDSVAGDVEWGGTAARTLNNTITAGKHLVELRVTTETLVEVFIDGRLEYSETITNCANRTVAGANLLARRISGGNMEAHSDAAIYEVFCTNSTGRILSNIEGELATAHGITLL